MKTSTKNKIAEFLRTSSCTHKNAYNILPAFKICVQNEFDGLDSLINLPPEFCDFLVDNIRIFNVGSEMEYFVHLPMVIDAFFEDCAASLDVEARLDQEIFAKTIGELLVNGRKTKLLDIAAGSIPYGSMVMARDSVDRVTAQDMFMMSSDVLDKLNIDAKDEYIDEDTDVSQYDMLVSNHPCGATKQMIELGAKYQKPYFIRFCKCGLPKNPVTKRPAKDWQNRIRKIDPRIKFVDRENALGIVEHYGYVLDTKENVIKEVLDAVDNFTREKIHKIVIEEMEREFDEKDI